MADQAPFAEDLARFLLALQAIDATDGPAAGDHCAHRGAPPVYYDDETREALRTLRHRVDTESAEEVWEAALAAPATGPAVWFHGDVSIGNLLVRDGRLAAVIDFGTCGVGDPACDLVIAWTFLAGEGRSVFREVIDHDRRHLGAGPRLGDLEGADRACPSDRLRSGRGREVRPRDHRGDR